MKGSVTIVGLGPGSDDMVTSEVSQAIECASDVVGYIPYVRRIADRPGLTRHESDNRVELERAKHALEMASAGKRVVVVSSGDPGVFAMASAVFEAVELGPLEWRSLDIQVLPGISAMFAAAARVGAPLGHDFCAINLSDNLKPWTLIEKRLRLAIQADFAMAFYNPRSKARPDGFGQALDILRSESREDRIIVFARAVSTPDENVQIRILSEAKPEMADMRTVVLVGSSATRLIEREGIGQRPFVYTPRSVPA